MKNRALFMATITVLSMVVAGVGSASAESLPSPAQTVDDGDVLKPIEVVERNETDQEYRGYEPTREQLDKPVDLSTVPEDFSTEPDGDSGPTAATSIDWNDSDDSSDPPEVKDSKLFLASAPGGYYFKLFYLVAYEENVEVWVAGDLSWPAGDPRPDPTISEDQAEAMAQQFDENIYPPESEVFGEPLPRNGNNSLLEQFGLVPPNYYNTVGDSNRTVLLVDNVRDENYYDPSYPLYIAGFYSPTIQAYTNRNVMTVDAYNWKEINQTNEQTGYEGTLAHEYQHLIHSDLDGDETTWVNEGMSDYAEVITGYGVSESHLRAYEELPSNSLINWEDQGAINVLADYGIAFTWTMYLEDQYGQQFITDLAHDTDNGIQSVENQLATEQNDQRDFYELYQDFSTAVVTDDIEQPRHDVYHFGNMDVDVNTSNDVGTAGVYGTNYKEIDTSETGPITGVTVSGTDLIGTQWTTTTDPVTGEGQVLYSGSGNLLNRHAIFEVNLSETTDPTLSFDSNQSIEPHWDYGFVQVSTDGGQTWNSLSNANTDDSPDPSAHPLVKQNVPGLTGYAEWQHQEFDLSAYEGNESVLISFRYVTDWAYVEDGWWIKNVEVDGETVPTDTIDPYLSLREATGDYVEYQFTFIGIKENGNYAVTQLDMRTFDDGDEQELTQFLRNGNFETVIVASTWAGKSGEGGRVPVGVEFEYAMDNPGQGTSQSNGPSNNAKGQ